MKLDQQEPTTPRRAYNLGARAAGAQEKADRTLEAFIAALGQRQYDEITLEDVAKAAGVGRQTVIRHFGSKVGLLQSAGRRIGETVQATRARAAPGDPFAAIRSLVEDYEETGDLTIHVLAQESLSPELSEILSLGRRGHRRWVEETFGAALERLEDELRELRLTQIQLITDVYVWRLLRRDQLKSKAEVETVLCDLMGRLLENAEYRGG